MSLNTVKYKGELLAEDERISTDTPGVLGEYKELRADALEADTLDITVLSESGTIRNFKKNDKVEYFRSGSRVGVYYLQSVTRVGPKLYTLSALSAVGLLIVRPHRGGIYTGQTVAEVVAEICGDIPVLIETVYRGIKLYGWLPIASARDSLVQVLFAIGAWLHTDENGTLRVQKLWDGTASIIGPGSVHAANIQVKYLDPVSAVAVTEHQYIAGTEDVTLFEGTAQQGDVIEFDEPAHTLTAEGFSILESGANYAVLSAGTGKLTGKSYIHNRRVVTRTVTEGVAENVEPITDATLVSLVNSSAVAQRMAAYYACREQLTVDVNPAAEHAGHVVSLWNEWDKQQTLACIASRETKISGLLKSRTSALVGYLPPQPESSEYFDERVILTGSGEWTVPEGVTSYTRVLIDPGQGGKCGKPGSLPTSKVTQESSSYDGQSGHKFTKIARGFLAKDLPPAPGGDPGDPGEGGKILIETIMDAVPGTKIAYSCGGGGEGAPYEEGSDAAGSYGTHTTMGGSSADSGSSNPNGYTDFITGDTFAAKGAAGTPGGDGVGYDSAGNVVQPADIVVNGVSYTAGQQGTPDAEDEFGESYNYGHFEARSKGAHGGGPAYKANGNNGGPGIPPTITNSVNYISVRGGNQGVGATAMPPEKAAGYGTGGTGGNGGGGNGQTAWGTYASCVKRDDAQATKPVLVVEPSRSVGRGLGSAGGQGADGCILIYYRKFGQVKSGPFVQKGGGLFFDRLNKLFIV